MNMSHSDQWQSVEMMKKSKIMADGDRSDQYCGLIFNNDFK